MNRFLIIGLGSIGMKYKDAVRELFDTAEIFGLGSGRKLTSVQRSGLDGVLNSISDIDLHDFDFAIVASPATTHLYYLDELVSRGIPALVEKPLASSPENLVQMAQKVEQLGVPVSVGYVLRHREVLNKFKRVCRENLDLGRLLYVRSVCSSYLPAWRSSIDYRDSVSFSREKGGGVIRELSHELDYLDWIFGPLSANAFICRNDILGSDAEELCELLLVNKELNVPVSVHLDYCSPFDERYCSAHFEFGWVKMDILRNELFVMSKAEGERVIKCTDSLQDAFKKQISSLVNNLDGDEAKYGADFADGSRIVYLINSIEKLRVT